MYKFGNLNSYQVSEITNVHCNTCFSLCSGGSKGGERDVPTPGGPNSFNFMQFLGKFGKFLCWRPPGVGASSGKSWIRHCYVLTMIDNPPFLISIFFEELFVKSLDDKNHCFQDVPTKTRSSESLHTHLVKLGNSWCMIISLEFRGCRTN